MGGLEGVEGGRWKGEGGGRGEGEVWVESDERFRITLRWIIGEEDKDTLLIKLRGAIREIRFWEGTGGGGVHVSGVENENENEIEIENGRTELRFAYCMVRGAAV